MRSEACRSTTKNGISWSGRGENVARIALEEDPRARTIWTLAVGRPASGRSGWPTDVRIEGNGPTAGCTFGSSVFLLRGRARAVLACPPRASTNRTSRYRSLGILECCPGRLPLPEQKAQTNRIRPALLARHLYRRVLTDLSVINSVNDFTADVGRFYRGRFR